MRDSHLAKLSDDPWLQPYLGQLRQRADHIQYMEERLTGGAMTLDEFANAHEYYGLHFRDGKWIFREWAPNATAGLSTFRIAHLLKEATGKTALQNIHYLRIQEARRLLESSDMSCTDIAYETGFGDQSYFIKQFRKWMGITPAKYRKNFRA